MNYKYYICDVFTDIRFGGNQLAVFPDATGLTDDQMQKIAREFNFSETTFIFPPEKCYTRKVRIFTPASEVPFAGHPNIGTAFVLAFTGELVVGKKETQIVFEEKAGLVPLTLCYDKLETIWCELQAPEDLSIGKSLSVSEIAAALSLPESDIVIDTHLPQVASVGLPFIFAELRDTSALQRAQANMSVLKKIAIPDSTSDIHIYTISKDAFDIRTRMFAPLDGIPEDPATGSANCALAGLLAHHKNDISGTFEWKIAQGIEMGRPSVLMARAEKKAGKVIKTFIGGGCVMVSEGILYLNGNDDPHR